MTIVATLVRGNVDEDAPASRAEMILSESVMREKLEYIYQNPMKRGYANQA